MYNDGGFASCPSILLVFSKGSLGIQANFHSVRVPLTAEELAQTQMKN